ncbi:MAG: NAD(P)H-hydrate dehydratase [Granulosicoccus sp.]
MNINVTPVSLELLTAEQMQAVDKSAVAQGIDSYALMLAAGRAVSEQVLAFGEHPSILVLAGPGNNGGDGYVAARELQRSGRRVAVLRIGPEPNLASDAGQALAQWGGVVLAPGNLAALLKSADLVIDALFGAGLSRPLTGEFATAVQIIRESALPIVSIDVPSGLDGNSHRVEGPCVAADMTVTFFRYKPAHFLYPGRQLCGRCVLAQIGLTPQQLDRNINYCRRNLPGVFESLLPQISGDTHKFQRGHVLVRSGPIHSTGAARLSATTALYCGAGLVTMASSTEALSVNASHMTAVMLACCDSLTQWQDLLGDKRINTVVTGPANGLDENTQVATLAALASGKRCVLDADALSCWQGRQAEFIHALKSAKSWPVLTPHAGEFSRVFADTAATRAPSKLHQAKEAAMMSGAVIVFKGADTVISAPDGRAVINDNAPAWLATAGSGDVLTGLIAALLAQGMPAFEAACAGVWLHGQAGNTLGNPLCAEQLVSQTGRELSALLAGNSAFGK